MICEPLYITLGSVLFSCAIVGGYGAALAGAGKRWAGVLVGGLWNGVGILVADGVNRYISPSFGCGISLMLLSYILIVFLVPIWVMMKIENNNQT
jgi:hypothetical protein